VTALGVWIDVSTSSGVMLQNLRGELPCRRFIWRFEFFYHFSLTFSRCSLFQLLHGLRRGAARLGGRAALGLQHAVASS
jgi:hypothetical protein